MLKNLVDNTITDKDTLHSYLDTYEKIFNRRKNDSLKLLEIGNDKGGSLKLWYDYFENGIIHGIDINHKAIRAFLPDRIHLLECDAYDKKNIPKGIKFDIIIDDGSHTLEDMIKFLFYYIPLLTEDGVIIIEDIPHLQWIGILDIIVNECFPELQEHIKVYDLRNKKNRYDDILYVIDKRK